MARELTKAEREMDQSRRRAYATASRTSPSGIEDELEGLVGRGGELAGVEVMPQAQVALVAGYVGEFGEAGMYHGFKSLGSGEPASAHAQVLR